MRLVPSPLYVRFREVPGQGDGFGPEVYSLSVEVDRAWRLAIAHGAGAVLLWIAFWCLMFLGALA